jgi:fructose-1,6-bisphosphatase/inositol monophosphatase family enzyme
MGRPTGSTGFGPLTPAALNRLMFGLVTEVATMATLLTPRETAGRIKVTPRKPQGEVVTLGDPKLQRYIVRRIRSWIRGIGIIAEEPKTGQSDMRIDCTTKNGRRLFVTIDPLDGTKMVTFGIHRFVGVMISIVEVDEHGYLHILGSWIANVYTGEVFSAPVGSSKVYRTYKSRTSAMTAKPLVPWNEARVVVNCDPTACPDLIRPLVTEVAAGGSIGRLTAHGGSGGLMMVEELVGGEADVVVTDPFDETPWDLAPSRLFLQRGGYVQLRVLGDVLVPTTLRITASVVKVSSFGIWTHSSKVPSLRELVYM